MKSATAAASAFADAGRPAQLRRLPLAFRAASTTLRLAAPRALWSVLLIAAAPAAWAQGAGCGSLQNPYGPFDYRVERGDTLHVVERFHFTPQVEALVSGATGKVGGDLDYTLRAFPNHHRALLSVMKLAEKMKSPRDPSMNYPFECYFERAIRFQRDDPIPRMFYATYLGKQGRLADAKRQLADADKMADDNPFTYYNIGMVYADLKLFDEALAEAHKAYKMGFPRPGLRDRLKAAGKWQEPTKGN